MCAIHSGYIYLPTVIYITLHLVQSFQPVLSPHFFPHFSVIFFPFLLALDFFFSYGDSRSHFPGSCSRDFFL